MGEKIKILRNEMEKANNIVSNINRKLMTEYIQYLIAKSFYINHDRSQYSSYPYHPDELVESHVQNSVPINVRQRSKKWVASEDMTLLNNWSNFLADQPPQFKRLSAILLKKPCSYNILTDTLSYNNDTNKGSNSSLCGTIKIKQLIIDYNRMTKLYARLGKGICRCLNSCYYRAKLVLVSSSNPQVTGPFSEPEAHLCYKLFMSLQQNPNHTLDYACEQIGKSLNRPPQLIGLFLETLEQIKGNSIPKITSLLSENTTNTYRFVSNIIPPSALGNEITHKTMSKPCSNPTSPQLPTTSLQPVLLADFKPKNPEAPIPYPKDDEKLYDTQQCKAVFMLAIKLSRWPRKVNYLLVRIIKKHYSNLGLDFDALAHRVEAQSLRSIIYNLPVDWNSILKHLTLKYTKFPPWYLEPCVEMFDSYWKLKLMRRFYLLLSDDKERMHAQTYFPNCDLAYLKSFLTTLRVCAKLNEPEKVRHALLISAVLRSGAVPGSPLDWFKITRLHNFDLSETAYMTEQQLKQIFDEMKQTYLPNHKTLTEWEIIKALDSLLFGEINRVIEKGRKSECLDQTKALDLILTQKERGVQIVPKTVEIKDENETIEKQLAVGNAHECKPLQKDSPNSTSKTDKNNTKEGKVRHKKDRSHLSDNLGHKEIENDALSLEPKTLLKIKKEMDNFNDGKIVKGADFRCEAELMDKDKTISEVNNRISKKSKAETKQNESLTELLEMRRSLVKYCKNYEKVMKKKRMSLTPQQLRLYELMLNPSDDKEIMDRVETKGTEAIDTYILKEQLTDVSTLIKPKKIKKLKDVITENIEVDDKILEMHDTNNKKVKKTNKCLDKKKFHQEIEKELEVSIEKPLKQKSSKSKTPEIIDFSIKKIPACKKERIKDVTNNTLDLCDREIVKELSETPSKKLLKSKKRESKESTTEKRIRKKEKIKAQELNMDDNQNKVEPAKEITICKFQSTNSSHEEFCPEEVTRDATKKRTKSKKASINDIDNQEGSLNLEPSSHGKKHKVKVAHHVNDEDKDVLIKVKKSKVKKAESLDNVDAPMLILDADQNESNDSLVSKLKKKERTLIDNPNNESVFEIPSKKKSKIMKMNDDGQETMLKGKKSDKKDKVFLKSTEQLSSSPNDLEFSQDHIKTSKIRRKRKSESDSLKKSELRFAKAEKLNLSDDESIQIWSPTKINETRDKTKKHLVVTIEDSDDI